MEMEANVESLLDKMAPEALKNIFAFIQKVQKKIKAPSPKKIKDFPIEKMLEDQIINKKYELFNIITKYFLLSQAKEASKQERFNKSLYVNSLVYGEINFMSLAHIFHIIRSKFNGLQKKGGVFYDLGSGQGKGVVAALLLHQFDACIGIEILDSLFIMSQELKKKVENQKEDIIQEMKQIEKNEDYQIPQLQFVHADFREYDWSNASIAYASSTCFEPNLMKNLCNCAQFLAKNTFFITLTKKLPDEQNWNLIAQLKHKMSWGETTVNIQIKTTDPIAYNTFQKKY